MKVHYGIYDFEDRRHHISLDDNLAAITRALAGGPFHPKTLHAVLTDNDLQADRSLITRRRWFSQEFNMHFDGSIRLDTEEGPRAVPFGHINSEVYATGFRAGDEVRRPEELLRQMDRERRFDMDRLANPDKAYKICQAIVARAHAFAQREPWMQLLHGDPAAWPERQREGLKLLRALEDQRTDQKHGRFQALLAYQRCQAIVAKYTGLPKDYRARFLVTAGTARQQLFLFPWKNNGQSVSDQAAMWGVRHGLDCLQINGQLKMLVGDSFQPCDVLWSGKKMAVYAEIPNIQELAEEGPAGPEQTL